MLHGQSHKRSGSSQDFPGLDSALPLQGAQVRSLVGELRSHMPHGKAKKKKEEKKKSSSSGESDFAWEKSKTTEISGLVCYCSKAQFILADISVVTKTTLNQAVYLLHNNKA